MWVRDILCRFSPGLKICFNYFLCARYVTGVLRQKQLQQQTTHKKSRKHDRDGGGSSDQRAGKIRKSRSSPAHMSQAASRCDSDEEAKEVDSFQTLSIQVSSTRGE